MQLVTNYHENKKKRTELNGGFQVIILQVQISLHRLPHFYLNGIDITHSLHNYIQRFDYKHMIG